MRSLLYLSFSWTASEIKLQPKAVSDISRRIDPVISHVSHSCTYFINVSNSILVGGIEISLISQFLLLASSEIKWSPRHFTWEKTQVISLVSSLVFWRDFNSVLDSLLDNKIPNEISLISQLLLLDESQIFYMNKTPVISHMSPLEVFEEI